MSFYKFRIINCVILITVVLTHTAYCEHSEDEVTTEDAALSAKQLWDQRFPYVARWRGPRAVGTAVLIAPQWCLTAKHVASKKIEDPSIKISISLGKKKYKVIKAFAAPEGDIALVQLDRIVTNVQPVAMLAAPLPKSEQDLSFTKVGGTSGAHRDMIGHSIGFRIYLPKQYRSGKGGDSGGAWIIEGDTSKQDIHLAVLHGGGIGFQPAQVRGWIDKTLQSTESQARWRALPQETNKQETQTRSAD
jgi:hypothetical protein